MRWLTILVHHVGSKLNTQGVAYLMEYVVHVVGEKMECEGEALYPLPSQINWADTYLLVLFTSQVLREFVGLGFHTPFYGSLSTALFSEG